jgi:ribosome-associated toxin RatA of RatAB toxin-antitoxin module
VVSAPVSACFALVEAVERYPSWYPDVVREVDVVDRGADGRVTRARTTLHVSRGPLGKDFHLLMAVVAEPRQTVTLIRLSHGGSDREELELRWRLHEEDGGTRIRIELAAKLSVPRLMPLGGIGDELAAGFVAAAANALGS